ncbi:MAG: hypothetical protein ACYDAG_11100, partial [Chloroflexota bacterium]
MAAWAALLAGFGILLGLVLLVRFTLTDVLPSWTDQQRAVLSVAAGTVEIHPYGTGVWSIVNKSSPLQEGDEVRTRGNGKAFVTLFDQSTVTLYPLTDMVIDRLRINHFKKPFPFALPP